MSSAGLCWGGHGWHLDTQALSVSWPRPRPVFLVSNKRRTKSWSDWIKERMNLYIITTLQMLKRIKRSNLIMETWSELKTFFYISLVKSGQQSAAMLTRPSPGSRPGAGSQSPALALNTTSIWSRRRWDMQVVCYLSFTNESWCYDAMIESENYLLRLKKCENMIPDTKFSFEYEIYYFSLSWKLSFLPLTNRKLG